MGITINLVSSNEIGSVIKLVKDSFDTQVSPNYAPEGIHEFYKYIDLNATNERLSNGHQIYVASSDELMVGIIEVRNMNHISMLFIHNDFRGLGIGTALIKYIVDRFRIQNVKTITVNSAPNSVDFYRKQGLRCMEEEKTINGIRFTRMMIEIM
ncbi:GNAT family N-acetyltransferase [Gorillibacterium timonense]|uniref:GNAT family N-acetyltransferase n=1 Tax=Gorillibacterium timonense TaxID=1689269 RepID=UPI00071DD4EE|nr:GNAT family N-acetyltransferase [Gorillibacterium timonense]